MNNVSVKAWYNTGFNSVNIPADVNGTWSSECYSRTFPALQILQHVNLDSIKIKASYPDVVDIDYIRLDPPYTAAERPAHGGSTVAFSYAYYFVVGATMLNGDTVLLSLVPDYVNTAGGFANLKILDGLTKRLTIKRTDDIYGKYTQEDPLLVANEPLVIDSDEIDPASGSVDVVYAESTIDLGIMGLVTESEPYTSRTGATDLVTVPKSYPNFHSPTKYSLATSPTAPDTDRLFGKGNRTVVFPIDYNEDYSKIFTQGIENVRSLGIESVISKTAVIPSNMVIQKDSIITIEDNGSTSTVTWTEVDGSIVTSMSATTGAPNGNLWANIDPYDPQEPNKRRWILCRELVGAWRTLNTNIALEYNSNVENKRALYGNLNKIGIVTNAGNKLEVKPEDVMGDVGNVSLVLVADPHLDGKPYYRFRYMNGEDGSNMSSTFFRNCVSALPWKSIPILYTDKSGNILDRENFINEQFMKTRNFDLDAAIADKQFNFNNANTMMKGVIGGALAGSKLGAGIPLIGGLVGGVAGAGMGAVGADLVISQQAELYEAERDKAAQNYSMTAQNEKRQFMTAQNVVAPDIQFPYNSEGYRDFFGEKVIAYRYHPTSADLERMDKVLNMYGYATTEPVTADLLNNRQKFVYIEANISVGGDIPKWLSDGVASQVSNGVRLWKVKPSTTYYERGGNP